jgi:hypothetical protein
VAKCRGTPSTGGWRVPAVIVPLGKIRRDHFDKALWHASQLTSGGAHVLVGRTADQLGFLGGKGPAVAVHESLVGTVALYLKVGEQRDYLGSSGHGDSLSWLARALSEPARGGLLPGSLLHENALPQGPVRWGTTGPAREAYRGDH